MLITSWNRHVNLYFNISSFSKRRNLRFWIRKSCAWIEWFTLMKMKIKSIIIFKQLLLIITNNIVVLDLDDTRRKKSNLSFNADFESLSFNEVIRELKSTSFESMRKKCFESVSMFFVCSNDCHRSNLQSFLKATAIDFCQEKYFSRISSSIEDNVFSSIILNWNEESNTTETANASLKKFLTLKKIKREREYKMTWFDIWMSETEMMNALNMMFIFVFEKIMNKWRWKILNVFDQLFLLYL